MPTARSATTCSSVQAAGVAILPAVTPLGPTPDLDAPPTEPAEARAV
jgi:hypothetical protein